MGYAYILLSALLFSTMEVSLKLAANHFNPIQLTFLRFLIGGVVLLPLALKKLKVNKISMNKADFRFFSLAGLICVVISMTFFQLGVNYSKASIAAILFSCNPIFVIPLAYFMLQEKISKETLLSLVMGILGILCIMNPLQQKSASSGIILTLLSAITFAFYGVYGRAGSAKFGGLVLSSFSFLMGSVEMLVLILVTRIPWIAAFLSHSGLESLAAIPIMQGISSQNILALIYIGVFITGLGYTFYFLAMEATSAATASLVFFIKAALAPVLALIILHESLVPTTIVGMVLIIASSCINFMANRKKEAAS